MTKQKEIKKEDITLEASLLKALAVKKNYDSFIKCLEPKRLISITQELLKDYKKYYSKYNSDIDWGVFYSDFCEWHRRDLDEHDLAYYRETVIPLINNADTSKIYISLLEREASRKIEDIISSGIDEQAITSVIKDLIEKKCVYSNESDSDVFTLGSLDLSVLDTSNGLTWCLPSIQAGLPSLMPGHFVLISADSDTGKSALCISQAKHSFLELHARKEFDRPILYCSSEDTKEDLGCRFLSNLYQKKVLGGFDEIVANYEKINNDYKKTYNDGLFVGMQIRGPRDLIKIEQKIEKLNPRLIIVDMLDKLSESEDIKHFIRLYQDIRGIANSGYPILGTTQSGNTSYQDKDTKEYRHRKWLSEKDVSGSKSGKQGAAYCMIMIGKDDDMPNVRYISTTKKKRGKHVQLTCEIIEKFSCYREYL